MPRAVRRVGGIITNDGTDSNVAAADPSLSRFHRESLKLPVKSLHQPRHSRWPSLILPELDRTFATGAFSQRPARCCNDRRNLATNRLVAISSGYPENYNNQPQQTVRRMPRKDSFEFSVCVAAARSQDPLMHAEENTWKQTFSNCIDA